MNVRICQLLYDNIRNEYEQYEVYSVFPSAVNLVNNQNALFSLVLIGKGNMPYSIMVEKMPDLRLHEKLYLNRNNLRRDEEVIVDLQQADKYDLSLPLAENNVKGGNIDNALIRIKNVLLNYGNTKGVLPLILDLPVESRVYEYIKEDFDVWANAYKLDNEEQINCCAKLAGFGIGLTPSMDDFLCGIMLSDLYVCTYNHGNIQKCRARNKRIIDAIAQKTTRLSYHMLKLSANGYAMESVRKSLLYILSDDQNLENELMKVLNHGESSGTDILCGIYYSLRVNSERNLKC